MSMTFGEAERNQTPSPSLSDKSRGRYLGLPAKCSSFGAVLLPNWEELARPSFPRYDPSRAQPQSPFDPGSALARQ